jgi:hypothetical protein
MSGNYIMKKIFFNPKQIQLNSAVKGIFFPVRLGCSVKKCSTLFKVGKEFITLHLHPVSDRWPFAGGYQC